jgi:hypothetical protein
MERLEPPDGAAKPGMESRRIVSSGALPYTERERISFQFHREAFPVANRFAA